MTSRERVLAALNHQEPDRVPLDMGGSFVTGIAVTSLYQLRKHLGLEDRPIKIHCLFQMLGEVEMDLVERLQLDVLPVEPLVLTMGLRRERWKPWTLFDGTRLLVPGDLNVEVSPEGDWLFRPPGRRDHPPTCRMPKDGYYFDTIGYGDWDPDFRPPPIEKVRENFSAWLVTDETLDVLRTRSEHVRRNTDKAALLGSWGMTGMHYVGKLTEFLCLLSTDREYVKDLFEVSTDAAIANLERLWDALGESIDAIAITGLDFGSQRGELFSPECFREVYLPSLKRHYDWIHEHTTWKVFEHSCGSIGRIVQDMADAGLDALNPVQTSAANMDPQWLKDTVGDRVTFWGGGLETQSTLPFGTVNEVREAVRERIRIFAPGGGMVFTPVHNIQACTPPENIVAAYEAALEFGKYPIDA